MSEEESIENGSAPSTAASNVTEEKSESKTDKDSENSNFDDSSDCIMISVNTTKADLGFRNSPKTFLILK